MVSSLIGLGKSWDPDSVGALQISDYSREYFSAEDTRLAYNYGHLPSYPNNTIRALERTGRRSSPNLKLVLVGVPEQQWAGSAAPCVCLDSGSVMDFREKVGIDDSVTCYAVDVERLPADVRQHIDAYEKSANDKKSAFSAAPVKQNGATAKPAGAAEGAHRPDTEKKVSALIKKLTK